MSLITHRRLISVGAKIPTAASSVRGPRVFPAEISKANRLISDFPVDVRPAVACY
jgi:hypothetical protein